jgi:hypothetical protein
MASLSETFGTAHLQPKRQTVVGLSDNRGGRIMRALLLAALACLITAPAGAQERLNKDSTNFGEADPRVFVVRNIDLIRRYFRRKYLIKIDFHDGVTDGCLPRPSAIKTAIELGLRRAGLNPDGDDSALWLLTVSAFGSELKYQDGNRAGHCNVGLNAEFVIRDFFRDYDNPEEVLYFGVPATQSSFTLYSDKSRMQENLRETVSEVVDEFANEILKATQE